jgi:hypothetical protein
MNGFMKLELVMQSVTSAMPIWALLVLGVIIYVKGRRNVLMQSTQNLEADEEVPDDLKNHYDAMARAVANG